MYLKNIDIEGLMKALESLADDDLEEYYFDVKSGQIVVADNDAKVYQVEQYPERFIVIKPLQPDEVGQLMDSFVSTVSDDSTKKELENALLRNRNYSSFKEVLAGYPEALELWKEFHKVHMLETTNTWLSSNNVLIS